MKVLGHSRDTRPLSMLERRPIHPDMLLGGVLAAIAAHIAVPIAVLLATKALAATVDSGPERYIEENIVEARFVQKGVKRDPDKLPDRIVPRKSTTPIDDSTVVSKNMNPEPPEKKEKPPPDAEKDLLQRIGDRAQQYAEIAEQAEKEGEEDGIEDGTETVAQAGDIYAGQLYSFFRKNWTIPNTLADPTKFNAAVDIEITTDMRVSDFKVARGSGDPLFDQSIEDLFNKLRSENTELPDPPPEVEHRYRGRTISINFSGKKR